MHFKRIINVRDMKRSNDLTGTIGTLTRVEESNGITKPRILIIYTGGTIGMTENPVTGRLEPYNFANLIENVPKLRRLDFNIDYYQFDVPVDSSAINPNHWVTMAHIIEDTYDQYDGYVVLHGTDTMAYTAERTPEGEPMIQEVCILFENYLWRGNRSTKYSADNFNAFKSNNFPRLAKIGLGISFRRDVLWRPREDKPLTVHYGIDPHVIYLSLFPGLNESIMRYMLEAPDLRGVVLKTFGAGNAPTDDWFVNTLKEAVDRGLVIVNVTQCHNGMVDPYRYETGEGLRRAGVISGKDLTSEAAITKLMFLFGQGYDREEVKRLMEIPLVGEMHA